METPSTPTLLAAVLPTYEFRGAVAVRVHASPRGIFRAVDEVSNADMPLARALGAIRNLPYRLRGRKQDLPMQPWQVRPEEESRRRHAQWLARYEAVIALRAREPRAPTSPAVFEISRETVYRYLPLSPPRRTTGAQAPRCPPHDARSVQGASHAPLGRGVP